MTEKGGKTALSRALDASTRVQSEIAARSPAGRFMACNAPRAAVSTPPAARSAAQEPHMIILVPSSLDDAE